jgi:hypothetical protein
VIFPKVLRQFWTLNPAGGVPLGTLPLQAVKSPSNSDDAIIRKAAESRRRMEGLTLGLGTSGSIEIEAPGPTFVRSELYISLLKSSGNRRL